MQQSAPDDWHKIEEGPTYRNRFGYSKGPGSRWRLEEDSHHTILVYTPDVDLTIAYGMHYHSQGRDEPEYEWSQVFASKSVRAGFADISGAGRLSIGSTTRSSTTTRASSPWAADLTA